MEAPKNMSNLQNPAALNSISPLGFWDSAIGALSRELSPQQFKTWIEPLLFISFDDSERILTVGAPNRFKLDWIKKTFADRFQELASQYFDRPININFVIAVEGSAPIKPMPPLERVTPEFGPEDRAGSIVLVEEQSFEIEDHSKLNPNLTFETFVTGKANQLARAASIQVAHNPGTSYNPMFLYGGVGLGKTHLIHAIGNHLLKEKPNARIRYIHAEQYVSDVVRAYQQKAFDRFKRYYHSLDLLLIDDIQFFSGKSRTQEEFFYAFEALLSNKSQVIITSDTYPKEMAGIDDRLISRFDSGLTVAIEPPRA
jgi:chromosomal replication initiator protein